MHTTSTSQNLLDQINAKFVILMILCARLVLCTLPSFDVGWVKIEKILKAPQRFDWTFISNFYRSLCQSALTCAIFDGRFSLKDFLESYRLKTISFISDHEDVVIALISENSEFQRRQIWGDFPIHFATKRSTSLLWEKCSTRIEFFHLFVHRQGKHGENLDW